MFPPRNEKPDHPPCKFTAYFAQGRGEITAKVWGWEAWTGSSCAASNALLLGEELFDLVHPRLCSRIVAVPVLLADRVELAQQLALPVGEVHRRLDHHMAQQVAGIAAANALDALAAQAKDLARLGLGGHLDLGAAVERGDLDVAAERGGGEPDRHLAVQV